MTSPYLDLTPRPQDEVARAQSIRRLKNLAARLLHAATLAENAGNASDAKQAQERKRDAWAIEWALKELER